MVVISADSGEFTATGAQTLRELHVRRLFTADEAMRRGVTRSALRWGTRTGRWRQIDRGVFVVGADDPTPIECAVAAVLACHGTAIGTLAGVLHELDSVRLIPPYVAVPPTSNGRRPDTRRRLLSPERVITVKRIPCTDGLQTLVDLAAELDDLTWEQVLESALRRQITTVACLNVALGELSRSRAPGVARIRRVLELRPEGAPPTESLLETLMLQLARDVPDLREPTRQLVIHDRHGRFVARLDLAWPELGLFIELDGQQHKGQPVYDASRETAVVASTGWLCGRFTWTEVTRYRRPTTHRLAELADQARRRPLPGI